MGMFDEVHTHCPNCGEVVEFQTKAGSCTLSVYNAERGVPPEIAVDLDGYPQRCLNCDTTVTLRPLVPIREIPMEAVVYDPDDD
ncbi:hypothetical protein MHM88_14695 [Epibacterium sp. MM17-32]|uniref:hypothetical protein n=1 Tax=Epibacterium sp. MM17-32 TaxID=2917734 RepID=UPI001EF51E8F|nr:hypothetical protein [Epibacterium sp. MM17-32]MCG7629057.1 hypothetical protein [Epibacterium sp. MM17-32]